MRPVYAVSFDIPRHDSQSAIELFDDIKARIGDWITTSRYWDANPPPSDWAGLDEGRYENGSTRLRTETHHVKINGIESVAWNCNWQHPDQDDGQLTWNHELKLLSGTEEQVKFHLTMSLSSATWIMVPADYDLGTPRIVRDLIDSYTPVRGPHHLTTKFTDLRSAGVQQFVNTVLLSPERRLPVVIVSSLMGRPAVNDANRMARQLAGQALVYTLDRDASWQLTDEVGPRLSCWDGAVRIYWPELELDSAPTRHHYWRRDTIEDMNARGLELWQVILNMCAEVSSFRDKQDTDITTAELQIRENRRKDIDERLQKGDINEQDMKQLWDEWEDSEREIDQLKNDNAELRRENYELQAEMDIYDQNIFHMQRWQSGVPEDDYQQEAPNFAAPWEAVNFFRKSHPDGLIFLDSALETAKESQYRNPYKLHRSLVDLDTLASLWTEDKPIGESFKMWMDDRGWDYAIDISRTARGKHRNDYTFHYNGNPVLVSHHYGVGRGGGNSPNILRVYLYIAEPEKKIVVCHIGRHLPDDSF